LRRGFCGRVVEIGLGADTVRVPQLLCYYVLTLPEKKGSGREDELHRVDGDPVWYIKVLERRLSMRRCTAFLMDPIQL